MTTVAEIVGYFVIAAVCALVIVAVCWQIKEWIGYHVDVRKIVLDHRRHKKALRKLLAAKGDHMTACDRTMGATHPCTCGADDARQLLK